MKKGVMAGFIVGFCAGVIIIPLSGLVFIELGFAPVATSSSPLPLERWVAKTAMNARISKEAPKTSAIAASETNLVAGAEIYRDNCAGCHGSLTSKSSMAPRMFPHPPQLLHGTGVTDDPAGYTYWKVANGIRLSGMPSFGEVLSQTQMWQVSQTLADAHHLPSAATNILTSAQ
jgi:thiosulfate dehydrogenase